MKGVIEYLRARPTPATTAPTAGYHATLTKEDLLRAYRLMVTARRIDDRELTLQKTGHCWFTISGAGKEAALVAAGFVLRPTDPIVPYYRDRALVMARGVTIREMLLQATAAAEDPASGGRQMPAHFGHRALNVVISASPTGSNAIPASGLAEAIRKLHLIGDAAKFPRDSVVYASVGDATCSEGEVYEAVKNATQWKAPLIFHVMDDGYGISVPASEQHPGGNPARLFSGLPGLTILEVDGTVFRNSYDTFRQAVEHARSGRGPVLVHSRVARHYSHSSTDDQRKYRAPVEVTRDAERDPIERLARELTAYAIATPQELLAIHEAVDAEIETRVDEVIRLPKTDTSALVAGSYAPRRDVPARGRSRHAGEVMVLAEAVNRALEEILEADPRAVMWGEDLADFSQANFRYRDELPGKGGVFGITKGLQRRFGPERVFNAPIAEATIVGKATGFALAGFLPIVEVQFRDYLNPAWQQLVDIAATMAYRSNGAWSCPMVIRMSHGSYLGGAGALWHSESAIGPLLNYPGLRVCVPSNARDAVACLREAATCGDVVLFCECKALYRRKDEFLDQPYPDFDWRLPLGSSRLYGDGKDLTIVTYGNTASICHRVMRKLGKDGVRARMLDLPWLAPMDEAAIRENAKATGKVLIVDEDRRAGGAGATIADAILKDRALRRKVDIERVAALDCRVSYGPVGERAVVPQEEDILRAARALLE